MYTVEMLIVFVWGQLQLFSPGCVSMGVENRPILNGVNDENSDPLLIEDIRVFYDLEIYPSILVEYFLQDAWQHY